MTSKQDFEKRFIDLVDEAEKLYPLGEARIKFTKDKENKGIMFVANSAGFVHWGLRLAGSEIRREHLKPQLPEVNVMQDGDLVAKDSDFDFAGFVRSDELRSEPSWEGHFASRPSRFKRAATAFGCALPVIAVLALALYGLLSLLDR